MATIETKVSDLSGETGDVQTYTIGIEGDNFDIDLTPTEFADLQKVLWPYIEKARKSRSTGTRRSARGSSRAKSMREWLTNNGYTVPSRGRIPADLVKAYETKTPKKK